MKHAFTVDLEDWFHGIPVPKEVKHHAKGRLEGGTRVLIEALHRYQVKATFFVLGDIAANYPGLLREIENQGHEIGSHGFSHDFVYSMSPDRFREETRASIRTIEDCIGKAVRCYRAPYFSITRRSLWALDILASEGIWFDSSIFPLNNWRYGIPDFPQRPLVLKTEHGPITEFPITVRRVFGRNLAASGGAYFRLYPYWFTRWNFMHCEHSRIPAVFYIHPWELDPTHPVIRFSRKAMLTHYANLDSTRPKLERLLGDFRFDTLSSTLSMTPYLHRAVSEEKSAEVGWRS